MRNSLAISILILTAATAYAEDPLVVIASSRTGKILFFDANLDRLGGITVDRMIESVTANPDGRRLWVGQEDQRRPGEYGLFSVDLRSHRSCPVVTPALFGAPSVDGRLLFTQGAHGVDVFETAGLLRIASMKAPGAYNLQPSPDGHWLMGITNSPKPSLDVFDTFAMQLVRRIPIPAGPATGAWAGDRFYVFVYTAAGRGQLWSLNSAWDGFSASRSVELPDLHGGCDEPVLLTLAGSPGRLYLAEAFGHKIDRRLACPDTAGNGIFAIDPNSGHAQQLPAGVRINRMVAGHDGSLYAIDSRSPSPLSRPKLVQIDSRTGGGIYYGILHAADLDVGEWNVSLGHIPSALIPRDNGHAMPCSR